jgi:hypothetical protein
MNPTPVFSQPLNEYVNELLGDSHYRKIEQKTARLIIALPRWNEYCHVQFVDRDDEQLRYPVLWNLHAWRCDTESWRIAKTRADKRRIDKFLFDANVEIIKRAILKSFLVTPDQASVLAHKWLRDNAFEKINKFNVKLKTKEEEL